MPDAPAKSDAEVARRLRNMVLGCDGLCPSSGTCACRQDIATALTEARRQERERAAKVAEERAAYFERTKGHWTREDTARSYRAHAAAIRALPDAGKEAQD